MPPQSASLSLAGSVAVGLTDLAFPGASGEGYTLVAGGMGGQVSRLQHELQACATEPHWQRWCKQCGAIRSLNLTFWAALHPSF